MYPSAELRFAAQMKAVQEIYIPGKPPYTMHHEYFIAESMTGRDRTRNEQYGNPVPTVPDFIQGDRRTPENCQRRSALWLLSVGVSGQATLGKSGKHGVSTHANRRRPIQQIQV